MPSEERSRPLPIAGEPPLSAAHVGQPADCGPLSVLGVHTQAVPVGVPASVGLDAMAPVSPPGAMACHAAREAAVVLPIWEKNVPPFVGQ